MPSTNQGPGKAALTASEAPKAQLKILEIDPFLAPYSKPLSARLQRYEAAKARLGPLADFANGSLYYGFHSFHEILRQSTDHCTLLHY
jgi:1,4-alpha-glucan branching enzyme